MPPLILGGIFFIVTEIVESFFVELICVSLIGIGSMGIFYIDKNCDNE